MTITATVPRATAYRGRLRWWTEVPLIALVYSLYSAGRLLVRGDVDGAVEHGIDILHFEEVLRIDPERWLNSVCGEYSAIGIPADFAYASLHYVMTPVVLVWLWRRRPTHYRTARTWLMLSTLIGLIGFTLTPTAPPRLLDAGYGFIDTMAQYGSYGWWGADASAPRGLGGLTNQYAAMPSLHVGWALWCGIMLWRYGRTPAVRALGVTYPLVITFVVMGTANHYLLDAVAGAVVMGIGFRLTRPVLRLLDAVSAGAHARWTARAAAEPGHSASPAAAASSAAPRVAQASIHLAGHVQDPALPATVAVQDPAPAARTTSRPEPAAPGPTSARTSVPGPRGGRGDRAEDGRPIESATGRGRLS